jgi:hypothetical protein
MPFKLAEETAEYKVVPVKKFKAVPLSPEVRKINSEKAN